MTAGSVVLSASATSMLAVSFASTDASVCTVAGNVVSFVKQGLCPIMASQAGNINYVAAAHVQGSFQINQASNVINFATPVDHEIGSGSFDLVASANSGLSISFASTTPDFCAVAGVSVSLIKIGACSITATQVGNVNYLPAAAVVRGFNIVKHSTGIVVTSNLDTVTEGLPIVLTVHVDGHNPTGTVTFMDGDIVIGTMPLVNGVATLPYTPTGPGQHVITASYGGDTNNEPLPASGSTPQNIAVAPKTSLKTDLALSADIDAQVNWLNRYSTTQQKNVADHLNSLHTRNHAVFRSNLNVSGVAVVGQIQPTADVPGDLALSTWLSGDITFGHRDGSEETKFTTSGLSFGLDAELSQSLVAGLALGYGNDDTKIGSDGSRNTGRNGSVTVYADIAASPSTFIDVLAGYGQGNINTSRYSTGGDELIDGSRDTRQIFGSLAVTHESTFDGFTLAPYGKLAVQRIMADAYTEDGSSPWRLNYDALDVTSVVAVAGVNGSVNIPVSWGSLIAKAHADYAANIVGDYTQNVGYADGVGASGSIIGHGSSNNQFNAGFDLDFAVDSMNGSVGYQFSQSANDTVAHSVKASLGFKF